MVSTANGKQQICVTSSIRSTVNCGPSVLKLYKHRTSNITKLIVI